MTVNIEKMRADTVAQNKQLAWENRKFFFSTIIALAAAIGAGVGIGNLIWGHQPPPAPAQIIFQPGSIVVPPVLDTPK